MPESDHGGTDAPDGRGVRYLEWSWDPDPGDSWSLTEYAFLLRAADGAVRAVHETHRLGLFSRGTWLELLAAAGFAPDALEEHTTEDRPPRTFCAAYGRPDSKAGQLVGFGNRSRARRDIRNEGVRGSRRAGCAGRRDPHLRTWRT